MTQRLILVTAILMVAIASVIPVAAQDQKPNILVIFGDDIGMWNISAYHRGMMGGSTPNIDRIANEGALFTDYYAQQSCTAGRAAFITGQHPFRCRHRDSDSSRVGLGVPARLAGGRGCLLGRRVT